MEVYISSHIHKVVYSNIQHDPSHLLVRMVSSDPILARYIVNYHSLFLTITGEKHSL
jgi:hypothetical protein